MQFHKLSIIIPVYNERHTVMKLLQRVAMQPISLPKELIIVDDFSTDGSHRVQKYHRYMLNRLFSVICNLITGLAIHDVTACYKVFRRELIENMHLQSDRFSVETEMTVKAAKLHARIYEVPIAYRGRTYAEGKKISWHDGYKALYDLVRYSFSD
jgi:cellulose synthase/poly-beta-1,6-N-acetylglucosamine synthase-like glycosyltransferase